MNLVWDLESVHSVGMLQRFLRFCSILLKMINENSKIKKSDLFFIIKKQQQQRKQRNKVKIRNPTTFVIAKHFKVKRSTQSTCT